MASADHPIAAHFHTRIQDIPAQAWNALAGSAYPFLRHEFLLALEQSGCVCAETGWRPLHVTLQYDDEGGEETSAAATNKGILALMPLYLKSHSYGEYVFDWSWADAYHSHGLDYYPKLLTAIPFTPAAGPRLCVAQGPDQARHQRALVNAVMEQAQRVKASSWHLLFPPQALSETLAAQGLAQRSGCQYQWFNRDYQDFDHFLASFNSRKRKNVRKERQRVQEAGIHFQHLQGTDITEAHWRQFYHFYRSTYLVRGREPYLNLDFFQQVGASMGDSTLLVLAHNEQGRAIAGALSFIGEDTLYGRYWGCLEAYHFLHFETCYYQGIDYCIARGLQRFDSGAQGEHKIQRGFEPVPSWSNHWLAHPAFRHAVADFVSEEAEHMQRYRRHASGFLPFRQDDPG